MAKLYKVTATIEYVIAVEDNLVEENLECARDAIRDIDIYDTTFSTVEINSEADLPYGWDIRCYPYRYERNTPYTIGEMLNLK